MQSISNVFFYLSTLSNTSGGSSGNAPGSESEGPAQSSTKRPKEEPICAPESEKPPPAKRRKRNLKKGAEKKRTAKPNSKYMYMYNVVYFSHFDSSTNFT